MLDETRLSRRGFVAAVGIGAALATGAFVAGTALGDATDGKAPAQQAPEGAVLDFKGRQVDVPEEPLSRVAVTCMGGATQTLCVLGGVDAIVANPSMEKSAPLLLKIFPQLEDVPDAGTFDDVNLETIAAAQPEMVFVASTSDKGNASIEDLGLATYTLGTANSTVESMRNDYVNVGKLLGTSDVADDLMAFWDDVMGVVDEAAAGVDDAARLSVYRCSTELTSANHTPWALTWIEAAGGVSVAEGGTTGDVSIEQVAAWDPDVIITSADVESILGNDAYADLKAVKNGAVYNPPKGSMGWDIPSPEVPLGFAWLGEKLYPDAFDGFDLEGRTREFYTRFYNYDLTDDELAQILKTAVK